MKIHFLTGGPAGMYCGSCIRDNALAAELIRQGHKVLLLPVYTPTVTDEENVSERRIFFGGVSVYLSEYSGLFRRMPQWMTRWLDSPALLGLLSRLTISNSPRQLGELTVSMLRGEHGPQQREFAELLGWLRTQPRPDVVSIPYTLLVRLAEPIKRALGCVVTCTLQGEDFFLESMAEPWRSEALRLIREHLDAVDGFIAVSDYYAEFMTRYLSLPSQKVHVVPLGIHLEGYDRAPRDPEAPFTVGYFARVAPEKGLRTLAEAYRLLRTRFGVPKARLQAAGYLAREHRSYLSDVERALRDWGLGREFEYFGVLSREEKIKFLQRVDVLSVPASYADPKGLFLLEAMACGTPVVQPRHGAFPELIAQTAGGLLFEPGNTLHLAEKLHSLWKSPELRAELGARGYSGVREHLSVEREARRAIEVYENLLRRASSSAARAAG
jgi:glycosyltransferase involved in cell wall biosynthesis